MAEKSYPFSADSAGGGGKLVAQSDWQAMAHLWGPDCIDFPMVNPTYNSTDLPLNVVLSGSNLVISPGAAWVGGFYYKLDAPLTIAAPVNSGANPRTDLVVIRANLATGSVNIAIVTGLAAATPVEPSPKRILGDVWELPITAINLPANNGTKTLSSRRNFPAPGVTQVPWSRSEISNTLPPGSFTVDMDSNTSGGMSEGFRGRAGDMVTRTLDMRNAYTPDLFTVSNKPSAIFRTGYWRYIAPGTVQFSARFDNQTTTACKVTAGWFMGFNLPVAPSHYTGSIFSGVLSNPENRDGMPNLVLVTGHARSELSNTCALYYQNSTSLSDGLDGLTTLPGKSVLEISGIYETNLFEERVLHSPDLP